MKPVPRHPPSPPPVRFLRPGVEHWGILYGALWLNTALLAALALAGQPGGLRGHWPALAGWTVGLGVTAIVAHLYRPAVHDLLLTFSYRERLGAALLVVALMCLPVFSPGMTVIPFGFVCAAPLMLLLAVTPSLTRRMLLLTLAGGWLAALRLTEPWHAGLTLGFGLSWLTALGMVHLAFTSDLHGLSGIWPVLHLLRATLTAGAIGTLAGALAWRVWPGGGLIDWSMVTGDIPPGARERMIARVDVMDRMTLFWNTALMALATIGLILVLYALRRLLLRLARKGAPPEMLPGQEATVEMTPLPEAATAPGLTGLRGEIATLWGRWAAAMHREGLGRLPGETAFEHAARLTREHPEAAPPATITGLLERAHYSAETLTRHDVETMREMVQDALSLQSLRRGAPQEPLE